MLIFNTQIGAQDDERDVDDFDADEIAAMLVASGHTFLDVCWDDLGELRLPVEDDVIFICEGFEGLRSFSQDGDQHSVYLGDGALQMAATRSGDTVHLTCVHVPFLDRRLATRTERDVSMKSYISAWRRLMRALLDMAYSSRGTPDRGC
ncbi:hypothetical protein [Sorangium sp. So ce1151]|uniref:hypothetical protein n=1 Tax=Sorangium sp. So ce1151 TaxID=3133332 RepID=UPI003F640AEB